MFVLKHVLLVQAGFELMSIVSLPMYPVSGRVVDWPWSPLLPSYHLCPGFHHLPFLTSQKDGMSHLGPNGMGVSLQLRQAGKDVNRPPRRAKTRHPQVCSYYVCVNNFLCKVPVSECLLHARIGCQSYSGQQSQIVAQTQLLGRRKAILFVRGGRAQGSECGLGGSLRLKELS